MYLEDRTVRLQLWDTAGQVTDPFIVALWRCGEKGVTGRVGSHRNDSVA